MAGILETKRPARAGRSKNEGGFLDLRQRDQHAAGRIVDQHAADRALPPPRSERGLLVVAEHDQLRADLLGNAADFLDRLADRENALGLESLRLERLHALIEHLLGAFL